MSERTDHHRVRELFEQVCDLARDEQRKAIDRLCENEPQIRSELFSLLELDRSDSDLFADARMQSHAGRLRGASEIRSAPQEVDGFRIIRRIGSGGMGDVYEAEQQSPSRRVALKLMRRGVLGQGSDARFRRETQILATLKHPGIAQLFVTGVHGVGPDAVPYFAMELVEGEELTAYARSRDLPVADRLRLMIRIGEAVQDAHEKGVIHRDLKPENILVVDDPSGPRPKILDFGVAKVTETDLNVTTIQTEVGQLVGTLSYMSPEQIDGDAQALDARTDVHALGVILYELLAGERPFDLSGLPIHIAARIIREDEPSSLATLDRTYRGDLDTIVRRALEKDPARRYQTVRDLTDDLTRVLKQKPIVARPPSTMYQLSKFARRNKALVAGSVATFVALLIGLVGTAWFALDAVRNEREVRWQFYRSSIAASSSAFTMMQPDAAWKLLMEAPEEHRGWEWRHLSSLYDSSLGTLGDGGSVSISTDPERHLISVLGNDDTITVYDATTLGARFTIDSLDGISDLSERTASGSILCISSTRGLFLLDLLSGTFSDPLTPYNESLGFPCLSADGRRAAWAAGGTVHVAAVSSGERLASFVPYDGDTIQSLAIDPTGRYLAMTCGSDAHISNAVLIEIGTGVVRSRRIPERPLSVAFSSSGSLVAYTMRIRNSHVMRTSDFERVAELKGHIGRVTGATFIDETRIVTVADDRTVRTWDALTGDRLGVAKLLAGDAPDPQITHTGSGVVVCRPSKEAPPVVLSPLRATSVGVLPHEEYVYQVAYSPDGSLLAVGPKRGSQTTIWNTLDGTIHRILEGPAGDLNGMGFSMDGSLFIGSQRDDADRPVMHVWRTSDWSLVRSNITHDQIPEIVGSAGGLGGLRLSKRDVRSMDGRSHAYLQQRITFHGRPREWTIRAMGREIDPSNMDGESIQAVDWSPSGDALVCAMRTGKAVIWSMPDAEQMVTLPHPVGVLAVCFSPDGSRLATGGEDGIIRLWDTERWELLLELHGHESYVFDLRFSPDGSALASGSGDATVRLWTTESPTQYPLTQSRRPESNR